MNAAGKHLSSQSMKKKPSNRPGDKAIISIPNPAAATHSGGITIKAINNANAPNEHILNVKNRASAKISIPAVTIRVAAGPSTESKLQSELRDANNSSSLPQ